MPPFLVGFLFGLVTTPILYALYRFAWATVGDMSLSNEEKERYGIGVEKERWNDTA